MNTQAQAENVNPAGDRATPTHEQISRLATLLWREKGCPAFSNNEIWLEAERELSDPVSLGIARGLRTLRPGLSSPMGDAMRELQNLYSAPFERETTSL